jgi:transcription elongation GreA/GreB family factor
MNLIHTLLKSNQNALDTATKSSAGDKHETARAMIHLEQENNSMQMLEVQKTLRILSQIHIKKHASVKMGSLVKTDKALFYISVGLGKQKMNDTDFFAISPISPLAQKLMSLTENSTVDFNGVIYTIIKIV